MAHQDQDSLSIADRIQAMVFLATPHRGADVADIFKKIFALTFGLAGQIPFLDDLIRNFPATQSINDDFRWKSGKLKLHSFYETLPMGLAGTGIGKTIIVDKFSATLGLLNEHTQYLNGNHREICKFSSAGDPNYRVIRDAISSIADSFRTPREIVQHQTDSEHRRQLNSELGVSDAPEDDLMELDRLRMDDSCKWLFEKPTFRIGATLLDLSCTGLVQSLRLGKRS